MSNLFSSHSNLPTHMAENLHSHFGLLGLFIIIGLFIGVYTLMEKYAEKHIKENDNHLKEDGVTHRNTLRDIENLATRKEKEINDLRRELRRNEDYIRKLRLLKAEKELQKQKKEQHQQKNNHKNKLNKNRNRNGNGKNK